MYQHAQQKRRNWFARHKVLTAAGALVLVVGTGAALSGGGDDSASDKVVTAGDGGAAGKGGKEGKAVKKADIPGSGTFQIGSDVKPGTYRSVGNKSSGNCYWERAKDSKGDPDSIIANDNVTGTSYVTIKADDKIFKSQGCKGWELVPAKAGGAPNTTSVSGDGMYRVGADISPGTYRSTGNKADGNCYWERAKDALHGMDSIAANENVTGNGIVTITPQDAYFKTTGCAEWKKTG